MVKIKFNIIAVTVHLVNCLCQQIHDRRWLLARHIIASSAKNCPVLLSHCWHRLRILLWSLCSSSCLKVCLFDPMCTALETITSPGKWLKPFCPLCFSLSHTGWRAEVTCPRHTQQVSLLWLCYILFQYLSGISHSVPPVLIIKTQTYPAYSGSYNNQSSAVSLTQLQSYSWGFKENKI